MNYRLKQFFLFVFFIILYFNLNKGGISKYILVAMIIYINVLILWAKKIKHRKIELRNLIIFIAPNIFYIVSSFFIIVIGGDFSYIGYFVKDSIFITLPVIFSYYFCNMFSENRVNILKISFYALIVVFLYTHIPLYNSEDLLEGTEAFIFGAYLIYFIWKKEYKMFALASILCILAHKRIAIVAAIVCAFIYLISKIFKSKRKLFYSIIFIAFVLFQYVYIDMIYTEKIISYRQQYNIEDMGRSIIYSLIKDNYEISILFKGYGIGFVESFLKLVGSSQVELNLHCDILKIYIEIGFWGLLIYNIVHLIIYSKINSIAGERVSSLYFIMILFTFLNYLTDNISIYIYYLVPFYIIIFHTFIDEKARFNLELSLLKKG